MLLRYQIREYTTMTLKKALRKLLVATTVLLVVITTVVILGSIDAPDYDDHGLMDIVKEVPQDQNGYFELAFIEEDGFSVFDDHGYALQIREYLTLSPESDSPWDQGFVDQLLIKRQNYIDAVESSLEYEEFQLPNISREEIDGLEPDYGSIPHYGGLTDLLDLLLLQSANYARAGDLSDALVTARRAVLFSLKIQTESSHSLLSYFSGQAMLRISMEWLKQLATHYELEASQYDSLNALVEEIPSYTSDGYKSVWAGEFAYQRLSIEQSTRALGFNLAQSREYQRYINQRSREEPSNESGSFYRYFADEARLFGGYLVNKLLGKYIYHPNRVSQTHADLMVEMTALSAQYCINADVKPDDSEALSKSRMKFYDILLPNSIGKLINNIGGLLFPYGSYADRRCLSHSHASSVKVIIALIQHESETGELPDSLDGLVPSYMKEVPIDAFDGQPMRYSKTNRWLYSVGSNYQDDGGSLATQYSFACDHDEECMKNPTFSF